MQPHPPNSSAVASSRQASPARSAKPGTRGSGLLLCLLLAITPCSALAGRPLSSDDAGTAVAGTCQLEGWGEKAGSSRAWVLAPACGLAEGLELGGDYSHPQPRDEFRDEASIALKWAPASWQRPTAIGQLSFGLKAGLSFERPSTSGWRRSASGLLGLATLTLSEEATFHLNLGHHKERLSGQGGTVLNLAGVWMPDPRGLLFAEIQTNDRPALMGAAVRTIGGLWWLSPDKLGLSITASRQNGSSQTLWTAGFGWYGLEF